MASEVLARPLKACERGDGDGSQDADDGYDDHQFDERKAPGISRTLHCPRFVRFRKYIGLVARFARKSSENQGFVSDHGPWLMIRAPMPIAGAIVDRIPHML